VDTTAQTPGQDGGGSPSDAVQAARALLERLERTLEQRQAAAAQLQAQIASLEGQVAEARDELRRAMIRAARAGDEAQMAALLDTLDELGYVHMDVGSAFDPRSVPAARRRAFSERVTRLVAQKLTATTEPVIKAKLCWVLGLSGSEEAGPPLRSCMEEETDATVLANALHALSRCPPSSENAQVIGRLRNDDRTVTNTFGFALRDTLGGQAERLLAAQAPGGNNATAPGEVIVEEPTLLCLGLEWHIEGDDNRNCRVALAYRKRGEAGWREAMPLLRVENRIHPTYEVHPGNLLAGSVFNLTPETEYEVRLRLSDPDGGEAERIVTARTRGEPRAPEGGRILHVVPGDGGGTGTEADPIRGIPAADAAAEPGDILLLHEGVYEGQWFLKKSGTAERPIVWRGTDAAKCILDGAGAKECIRASERQHLFFENLTMRNARQALSAYNSEGIVVRRCRIEGVSYLGIVAQGQCLNFYIADNVMKGPARWPERKGSSYGISIQGAGHVICYNRITDFWDCISLASSAPYEVVTRSVDIYGNDFAQGTDDGVEADYIRHNVRIFRNRLTNTFSSLSFQPVFGGPGYLLHNAMYTVKNKPFKLHVDPTGMIIAHNTSLTTGRGFGGGRWFNAVFRNNIIMGAEGYAMESEGGLADMDYDGWNQPSPDRFMKFNRVRYATLDELAEGTGMEEHGVMVSMDIFRGLEPPVLDARYEIGEEDLQLKPGGAAVDAGVLLPNINDGFTGKAPDLGCYEVGTPVPHYGPRAQ
ncbi:MAG: right-handed parallel beta-helix repeat-containing protein, partial [Armatimonadota bacterium]